MLNIWLQGEALWCEITAPLLQESGFTICEAADNADLRLIQKESHLVMAIDGEEYTLALPIALTQLLQELTHTAQRRSTLTDKEQQLIAALQKAGTHGMTTAQLLEQVWQCRPDIDTHTVATHVNRVRKKLKQGSIAMINNVYVWQG